MSFESESASYRQQQENYVSNNNGTTAAEVCLSIGTIISYGFIYTILTYVPIKALANRKSSATKILYDFGLIVIPTIASLTVLSDYLSLLVTGTAVCFFAIYSLLYATVKNKSLPLSKVYNIRYQMKRRSYVTNLRAMTYTITAVCILAVDFKIFPLRFAKTETYGFSLMDTGVGYFVFLNALVAPEARDISKRSSLRKTLINSFPLIILGTMRLLATHMLNYHHHISEYGVHWNFFFTLACVKIVSSALLSVFPVSKLFPVLSLMLIVLYEIILYLGVQDWILGDAVRSDFLSSNREGIFSLFGYTAIYFSGVSLGQVLLREDNFSLKQDVRIFIILLGLGSLFWLGAYVSNLTVGVSRRLVNVGYCLWSIGLSIQSLNMTLLIEITSLFLHVPFGKGREVKPILPFICEAVNCHGLLFFLLANLLTGFVNLSISTLYVGPVTGFFILVLYMLTCCGVVGIYHSRKCEKRL